VSVIIALGSKLFKKKQKPASDPLQQRLQDNDDKSPKPRN
jgi:hypothetical protein